MKAASLLLLAAAFVLVVVNATDVESDAATSEDLSHLSAAERKLIGYINVHGTRKNWLNKPHLVHILGSTDDGEEEDESPSAPVSSSSDRSIFSRRKHRADDGPAPAPRKVVVRYEKFPFKKFLEPLEVLAKRMERQRKRGMQRYQRLRRLLAKRGLINTPEGKRKLAKAFARASAPKAAGSSASSASSPPAHAIVKSAHELKLEQELAMLHNKIAKREEEVRKHVAQFCDKASVYFCYNGRCACIAQERAKCADASLSLSCRDAPEVGRLCTCAAAAAASTAAKAASSSSSSDSSDTRRSRAKLRRWATRRKFLNKMYGVVYNKYLELLSKYFERKYEITMKEYEHKHSKNKALKAKLEKMLDEHKSAMMQHAQLHLESFTRFSQLMDSYRGLNTKYNDLVDKYNADLKEAQANVADREARLGQEKAHEARLMGKKRKLDLKIRYLQGQVAKDQKLAANSRSNYTALITEHQQLEKKYQESRDRTLTALAASDSNIAALMDTLAKNQEQVDQLHLKLLTSKQRATLAAKKAQEAFETLKKKYLAMQKQAEDAAVHNKAAEAALRDLKARLDAKLKVVTDQATKDKDQADKAEAEDVQKYNTVVKNARDAADRESKQMNELKNKIAELTQKLNSTQSQAELDANNYAELNKTSGPKVALHRQLQEQNLALQNSLRQTTNDFRDKIQALREELKATRVRRAAALTHLREVKAQAKKHAKKERAVRAIYDSLLNKYRTTAAKQKAAEAELTRLRNEIEEMKKNRTATAAAAAASAASKNALPLKAVNLTLSCGPEFDAAREANKQLFARRFDHYDFFKVRVQGEMSSENIARTCAAHQLQTPCDHPSYADGTCTVVLKSKVHFSFNPHHNFPRWLVDGTFWYTSNSKLSLVNINDTHRWSTSADRDGFTMCVLPAPCKPASFSWGNYEFHRVRVPGQVSNAAIVQACQSQGLEVPCDHPAYVDGNCVTVTKDAVHLSYSNHTNIPYKFLNRAYFYSGTHEYPLQSWHHSHRWAKLGDRDGVTLCVAYNAPANATKVVATWHGFNWYRLRINGTGVTSENILKTCSEAGYETPCEHPKFDDGRCVQVTKKAVHLTSSGMTSFPENVTEEMYFYTGSERRPYQSWRGTHRAADDGDKHGDTLCVSRIPLPEGFAFSQNHFNFYRERVNGSMTPDNVREACAKKNLFTPCDHPAYADGHCVVVVKRALHLSFHPHRALNTTASFEGLFFYAGENNRLLQYWRHSHRWADDAAIDGDTLCVAPVEIDPTAVAAEWNGYKFHKVLVEASMTNENIADTCKSAGYRVPCDKKGYADSKCVVVTKEDDQHMSFNAHHDFPLAVIDRTYWYTGSKPYPLQNFRNSHRWANPTGDMWEYTLCVE